MHTNAAQFVGQKSSDALGHKLPSDERRSNVQDPTPNKRKKGQKQDLRIKLNDVISFLKQQGYPLENTFVSYYSAIFSAYVNCNLDPVSDSVQITDGDLEMIENAESLRLKFQKGATK